jgi:hypothetical protein
VKTSWLAALEILKLVLVADVTPVADAVNVRPVP